MHNVSRIIWNKDRLTLPQQWYPRNISNGWNIDNKFIKIWYLVVVFSSGISNNPSWNKVGINCIARWRAFLPRCGIDLKHHLEEYLTNPLKSPMGLYHCSLLIMIVYKEILAVSSKTMNPLNMWIWWNHWSNCSFYI